MEQMIREMQHPNDGIPTKSQKVFLSYVPCAFTGKTLRRHDTTLWFMDGFDARSI